LTGRVSDNSLALIKEAAKVLLIASFQVANLSMRSSRGMVRLLITNKGFQHEELFSPNGLADCNTGELSFSFVG
jgi:hypothetical protein